MLVRAIANTRRISSVSYFVSRTVLQQGTRPQTRLFLTSSIMKDETQQGKENKTRGPKIYTKTGDAGTTSLFSGERRPKSDLVFDALGDVDELSSNIGLTNVALAESWQCDNFQDIAEKLLKIQCTLQEVNSCIATPLNASSEAHLKRIEFGSTLITELEEWIDFYTNELRPLKNFILPSGGKTACHIHVTRTVCRRAERKVTQLVSGGALSSDVGKYMNRLSDFLFTVARYTAMMEGHEETIYEKTKQDKKST